MANKQVGCAKSKTLLIGASGLCGGEIGRELVEAGIPVRAYLRPGRTAQELIFAPDDVCFGGLLNQAELEGAMADIDTVLYFASTSVPATSYRDPALEFQSSLLCLNNTLQAMERAGVGRIVFPSSGGAIYGPTETTVTETYLTEPTSGYGLGKLLAEETIKFYARTRGIDYTIVRLTNTYGLAKPRRSPQGVIDVFLDNVIAGRTSEIWGSLDVERDYLFVADVATGVLSLLQNVDSCNKTFNLGSSATVKLREIIEQIDRVTDGRHRYRLQPSATVGVSRIEIDSTLISQTTGWRPKWTLRKGIAETWSRKCAYVAKSVT